MPNVALLSQNLYRPTSVFMEWVFFLSCIVCIFLMYVCLCVKYSSIGIIFIGAKSNMQLISFILFCLLCVCVCVFLRQSNIFWLNSVILTEICVCVTA